MASVITDEGRNILLNLTFKSSPDNTRYTQFIVGVGATTPQKSDTYSSISGIPTGFPKNLVSGSPYLDTSNTQVINYGYISPSEANGITITECAEVNTDASPKTLGHDNFTGIVKDSSVEISFQWSHKVV